MGKPTWEVISSDGSDPETDIDDLQQTDSESRQIFRSGSGSNDTSTAAQTQSDERTPNTSEIGLVAKDGTKWKYRRNRLIADRLNAYIVLLHTNLKSEIKSHLSLSKHIG